MATSLVLLGLAAAVLLTHPSNKPRNVEACEGVREAAAALQTHVVRVREDNHSEPYKLTCSYVLGTGKQVFESLTFGNWSTESFRQTRTFYEGSYRVVGVPHLGEDAFAGSGDGVNLLEVLVASDELNITAPGSVSTQELARLASIGVRQVATTR